MMHHPSNRLGALMVLATVVFVLAGCSQFEPRDKRFYYRALWNFASALSAASNCSLASAFFPQRW